MFFSIKDNEEMESKRILIVDDNESIHEDIHNILKARDSKKDAETELLEEELFGDGNDSFENDGQITNYSIDDAYQGADAVSMVDAAAEEGFPYALIFMDVRMPPGIDGIQAVTEIWQKHPHIEVVICTAYSDYSWDQIIKKFGSTDHLLFMKKPFDNIALKQIALSLTTKWDRAKSNQAYIKDLEVEVKHRTDQLNQMVEHLKKIKKETEELTIAKSIFMSGITHELRTPLNGILGMTDLLLDTNLDDEQRNFAKTIKSSSESLMLIVSDILDFSKDSADGFPIDNIVFDVRTTIDNIVDLVSIAAYDMGLDIAVLVDCDVNDLLIGDPFRLKQVLLDLISYAIKLAHQGEIIISVSNKQMISQHEVELEFNISYTGVYISADQQKRLFSTGKDTGPLNQKEYAGDGLGLSVSKHLAELMNGQIDLESEISKGSTFKFTAPFGLEDKPLEREMELSKTIIGIRCLVISDYAIGRKVLSLHINHWGGLCKEASIQDDIIERIITAMESNKPFDAVLIDIKNGDLSVYKRLAERINGEMTKLNLPICNLICLTSKTLRGDAGRIKDYGYIAYLTKPIKQSHLYKSLAMVKSLQLNCNKIKRPSLITKYVVDELMPDYYQVLVVEDDKDMLKYIISCLTKLKLRCDVAQSGEKSIKALKRRNYDLLFMKFKLPDMDSSEIIDLLKKEGGENAKIPIIGIADNSKNETRKKCLEAGVSDCIVKPFDRQSLVAVLKKHFKI